MTVLPTFMDPGAGTQQALTLAALYVVVATVVRAAVVVLVGLLHAVLKPFQPRESLQAYSFDVAGRGRDLVSDHLRLLTRQSVIF